MQPVRRNPDVGQGEPHRPAPDVSAPQRQPVYPTGAGPGDHAQLGDPGRQRVERPAAGMQADQAALAQAGLANGRIEIGSTPVHPHRRPGRERGVDVLPQGRGEPRDDVAHQGERVCVQQDLDLGVAAAPIPDGERDPHARPTRPPRSATAGRVAVASGTPVIRPVSWPLTAGAWRDCAAHRHRPQPPAVAECNHLHRKPEEVPTFSNSQ